MALLTEDGTELHINTPIAQSTETPVGQDVLVGADFKPPSKPGFVETFQAIYQEEDPLFNLIAPNLLPSVSDIADPTFDAKATLTRDRPDIIRYADKFSGVTNKEQYDRKLFKIDLELQNQETIRKSSTFTHIAAGLSAGLVDPISLIPFVKAAQVVSKVGRAVKGLWTGSAVIGGSMTAEEAVLQATQETREASTSAVNIVAGTAMGGIFGAGLGALSNPVKNAGEQLLRKALQGEDFKVQINDLGVPQVAGTATSELDRLGLAHINETLVKVLSGPEALRPPDLRAILSPSVTVRGLGESFYSSNYIRNKHIEGEASGLRAQNLIFQRDQEITMTLKGYDDLYMEHTGVGGIRSALARPEGKISPKEFNSRVWSSLVDETKVDAIPQVNAAARLLRKDMDSLAEQLKAAKLLPEDLDPKFARNYMMRVYDLEKLQVPRVRAAFVARVGAWLTTHELDGTLRALPLPEADARRVASKHLEKVRGETDQQVALSSITEGMISKGKFLKKRSLLIPDSEISEFISTDASKLYRHYASKVGRLLETDAALKRSGHQSFQDVIKKIRAEGQESLKGLTDDAAIQMAKKFDSEEELATMMYRSLLGQLKKPGTGDRFTEHLLNYQFLRLLGGVTVSSLPDLAGAVFRHGFLKTLRDGYLPLIRSIKTARLSGDQLADLHGALEFEQSNVIRAFSGIEDIHNIGRNTNTWDISSQILTKGFVKATGIGYWTGMHRRIATQISAASIVRDIRKATLTSAEVERLASIGIGKDSYGSLRASINKYVQETNGTFVVNPHLWEDTKALRTLQNAIQVDVESTVLKPGIESNPFMVQKSNIAKIMFQFKSFLSSATGRILISGIQRRDANVLSGATTMVTLGVMATMLKDVIADRDIEEDPASLLMAGIAQSGMLGLIGNTVLDTGHAFYNEESNRFGSNQVSSAVLGPSAGQVKQLADVVVGWADGDIEDKDMRGAIKMIPFGNIFYLKALTDRAFPPN